jgi:hypothetical protein
MARLSGKAGVKAPSASPGPRRARSKSPSASRARSRSRATSSAEDTKIRAVTASEAAANEDSHVKYEFGGPLGALGVIVGLPLVTYALYFLCNSDRCVANPFAFDYSTALQRLYNFDGLVSLEAIYIFVGWMVFHVILERLLPGETADGAPLPRGGARLSYCLSGHLQFWITLVVILIGVPTFVSSGHQCNLLRGAICYDIA